METIKFQKRVVRTGFDIYVCFNSISEITHYPDMNQIRTDTTLSQISSQKLSQKSISLRHAHVTAFMWTLQHESHLVVK